MSNRRLLLLRHGRTAWNAERRFQGHADPPLDDVGRAQAYEVAAIIAALRPQLLVSSSAARAMQTAEVVAAATGLPLASDERLRERGLGRWEGRTLDEVAAAFPDEYADWASGQDIVRAGGETRDQVAARATAALAELPTVELTVVVTHGATTLAICNAMLGLPQEVHPLGGLANCHWSELEQDGRTGSTAAWRLRGHNLGAPGSIVPLPAYADGEASDADA